MKYLLSLFVFSAVLSAAEPKTLLSCKLEHKDDEDQTTAILLHEDYVANLVYVDKDGYRLQITSATVDGTDQLYDKRATIIQKGKDVAIAGQDFALYLTLSEAEQRAWAQKQFSALDSKKEYTAKSRGTVWGKKVELTFLCTI